MYQAGIKKISLYERKGVSYYFYNPSNANEITDLINSGAQITAENKQLPTFQIEEIPLTGSGRTGYQYKANFFILGYTSANRGIVKQIKESIYGWALDVEFYDGTHKFYDVPFKCTQASIDPNQEMAFELQLEVEVPSIIEHLDYTPGITIYSVFTFDSTLVTFDSTTDTFDYVYTP